MIHKIIAEPPFDTKIALIDDRIVRGGDSVDEPLFAVQLEIAADTAVGAGGRGESV
jgi:hypothetical protein